MAYIVKDWYCSPHEPFQEESEEELRRKEKEQKLLLSKKYLGYSLETIYEIQRNERRKNIVYGMITIGFILIIIAAFTILIVERDKWRGIRFEPYNESLPIQLPLGSYQLIPIDCPVGSSFVASSQEGGRLSILTNITNPQYFGYEIYDQEFTEVKMITHDFFCCKTTCYFISDIKSNVSIKDDIPWKNVTSNIIRLELPNDSTFVVAQHCPYIYDDSCHMILQRLDGSYRLATIYKHYNMTIPEIKSNERIYLNDFSGAAVIKAFRIEQMRSRFIILDKRYIHICTKIEKNMNGPIRQNNCIMNEISGVSSSSQIELFKINNALDAIIVKERMEGKTNVRLFIINGRGSVKHSHEYNVDVKLSQITMMTKEDSFQICHLYRNELSCLYYRHNDIQSLKRYYC